MKWFPFRKKNTATEEDTGPVFPFLIPRESVIHGSIEAPVACRLEGCIEGDVTVKGTLIVTEAAEVMGDITCDDIIVYGKVRRNIFCTGKARICANGYVEGTITAATLEIEETATVKYNMMPEEEEPEIEEPVVYDTVARTVISPSKVLVNESTWF